MKLPGAHDRTNNIVAALNNHGRNVSNLADVINQVIISVEENVVDEVMALDPGQGQRRVRLGIVLHQIGIGKKFGSTAFPD